MHLHGRNSLAGGAESDTVSFSCLEISYDPRIVARVWLWLLWRGSRGPTRWSGKQGFEQFCMEGFSGSDCLRVKILWLLWRDGQGSTRYSRNTKFWAVPLGGFLWTGLGGQDWQILSNLNWGIQQWQWVLVSDACLQFDFVWLKRRKSPVIGFSVFLDEERKWQIKM